MQLHAMTRRLMSALRALMRDVLSVYWPLLRVMVPTLLAVRVLSELGATEGLGRVLSPVMQLVGLPDAMGLVWAATMLTNLYTGLAVCFDLMSEVPLTVAQVSVLGTLLLVAHALPVEAAIARAAGVPVWATLTLRIGGALVLGAVLNAVYTAGGWLAGPATPVWQPAPVPEGWAPWLLAQGQMLLWVLVVISALMAVMALMRALHVERLLHAALAPVLRLIGIAPAAANITVVGATLGITLGAGLLLKDVRAGVLSRRDVFLALGFLGLFHSVIEDTLLVALMGAHMSAIVWARLAFALVVIALLARLPVLQRRLSEAAA
jgi:hypothetical protein